IEGAERRVHGQGAGPEQATAPGKRRDRFDQQSLPVPIALEVQRIALCDAVIAPCLDEKAAVEIEIALQLSIEIVEREEAIVEPPVPPAENAGLDHLRVKKSR